MAWLNARPYTFHRDWNDVDKFEGRFESCNYAIEDDELTQYDLTHRVEWAPAVAAGALGNPLDPYQEYTFVKNMGTVPVLLYHNPFSNWPNDPIEIVIPPGRWIEVVDLDVTDQPRIRVDSALYSAPAECEVIQIGYQYWEEQEPEYFCDAWAVGHIPQDGVGTKHYPEGAGAWATIASTITDNDHWLADVAGVDVADYWAVGYELNPEDPFQPVAGLYSRWQGAPWAECAVVDDPPMYGVWGFATDDYWSVGGHWTADGEVWHWNGVAWTVYDIPDEQGARTLYCVHGHDPSLVWAAGMSGLIVSAVPPALFSIAPCDTEYHFYGIWAANALDVWAVGGDQPWWGTSGGVGCVYRQTLMGWLPVAGVPVVPCLRACWGFASNDVWAVGDQGTIIHWDGFNWLISTEPAELEGNYDYRGVFGCEPNSIWAIGTTGTGDNVIIHWDGVAWAVVHGPNADEMDLLGLKGVEVVP